MENRRVGVKESKKKTTVLIVPQNCINALIKKMLLVQLAEQFYMCMFYINMILLQHLVSHIHCIYVVTSHIASDR